MHFPRRVDLLGRTKCRPAIAGTDNLAYILGTYILIDNYDTSVNDSTTTNSSLLAITCRRCHCAAEFLRDVLSREHAFEEIGSQQFVDYIVGH